MADTVKCLLVLLALFRGAEALVSGQTIYQTLISSQKLRTFGSWIGNHRGLYDGTSKFTVFAFNDSSHATMPKNVRDVISRFNEEDKLSYVKTFTVVDSRQLNDLQEGGELQSMSGMHLFIERRTRYYQDVAGSTGRQAVYINGARIVSEQIMCSNGIIHVLDRVLTPVVDTNVYNWLYNPTRNIQTDYWIKDLIPKLESQFYSTAVAPLANPRITFFLPSQEALGNIPSSKLQSLQGQLLADYFQMHYIPNDVVFSSYVEHQETYQSGKSDKRIMFLRNGDKVMVKCGEVTAEITQGNITLQNGVIHVIDRMFGYVYYTALEQMKEDSRKFSEMISLVPTFASDFNSKKVNMFVPTQAAMQYAENLPWVNFGQNNTLRQFILELSLIRDGSIEVSQLNGAYEVRQRRYSHYNNWKLVIYNDRNDTWVNGGNVRARIVRPDVAVSNGNLQYIDAVLGIPSYDIPTLIYYDDYLVRTYYDLKMVGLDEYMKDPRFNPGELPPRSFSDVGMPTNNYGQQNTWNQQGQQWGQQYTTRSPLNNWQTTPSPWGNQNNQNNQWNQNNQNNQWNQNNQNNQWNQNNQNPNTGQSNFGQQRASYGTCGDTLNVCQFTFFVPNGTATYLYKLTRHGRMVVNDLNRYRYVLRRLMIPNNLVFLEELKVSPSPYRYTTHSGEQISIRKETDNIVRVSWGSVSGRVILWDLGASNGVVHIIDTILSDMTDPGREINGATRISTRNVATVMAAALLLFVIFIDKYIL